MRLVPDQFARVRTGDVFGRITIIGPAFYVVIGSSPRQYVVVSCECGGVKCIPAWDLVDGRTRSCGCYRAKSAGDRRRTHGATGERLCRIWTNMIQRCQNPKNNGYPGYGGSGVNVCEEWQTYEPFRDWALASGYADNLTLDRRDGSGDYEPENCRWATASQQSKNKRHDKKSRSPFKGVMQVPGGKWRAVITSDGVRHHLGTFDSDVDAALHYDAAARKFHGKFASLNFHTGGVPS